MQVQANQPPMPQAQSGTTEPWAAGQASTLGLTKHMKQTLVLTSQADGWWRAALARCPCPMLLPTALHCCPAGGHGWLQQGALHQGCSVSQHKLGTNSALRWYAFLARRQGSAGLWVLYTLASGVDHIPPLLQQVASYCLLCDSNKEGQCTQITQWNMQQVKTIALSDQLSVLVLELRVSPLTLPMVDVHRAMEQYATTLRCLYTWAILSFISAERQGECTIWILCSRKEPVRRLDNAYLGFKRAVNRIIHGASVERRTWTKVQGRAAQVYTDVHAQDEDFQTTRRSLLELARQAAPAKGEVLVSGPLYPLPAPQQARPIL